MSRRRPARHWTLVCAAVLAFGLAVERSAAGHREHEDRSIWFVHATDPHIFVKPTEVDRDKQQKHNENALSDMWGCIGSLPDGQKPAFLLLTGDLGIDPCEISEDSPSTPSATTASSPTPTQVETSSEREPKEKDQRRPDECVKTAVNSAERKRQIDKIADLLGKSPIPKIYLIAGNNDIARESAGDDALKYFNDFIKDVQGQLNENKDNRVQLRNLTRCYLSNEATAECGDDIQDTPYRLIGFPSYSFKQKDASVQARHMKLFEQLLEEAKDRKVLIATHTPAMDDPHSLGRYRYLNPKGVDAETPAPAEGKKASTKTEGTVSTWDVDEKVRDAWKKLAHSDSVLAVLAGHLHDSHKEIYRKPYAWSNGSEYGATFGKLFLAPPLAIKKQDASPIQARGFSLVHLEGDRMESHLLWYDSETRKFTPDPKHKHHWRKDGFWGCLGQRSCVAIRWLWDLEKTDSALIRMAIIVIALLTAFLTIIATWQIPPGIDPFPDVKKTAEGGVKSAQATSNAAADSMPFSSRFGKTVIGGLAGLVAAEVTKTLGNEKPSADSRWYYIVWFVLFFFLLLLSLNLWRAFVEALRSRFAIVYYPFPRPPEPFPAEESGDQDSVASLKKAFWRWWAKFWRWPGKFWRWLVYRFYAGLHWLRSWLGVPLLTFADTFISLIQGKNQTTTRVFSEKIIEQQRNLVRVAKTIRDHLNDVILNRLQNSQPPVRRQDVRVNISVLSADYSHVFYIAWAPGSAMKVFSKRSLAWVSVFTGKIRWYKYKYSIDKDLFKEIVLFDNSAGTIADDEREIQLSSHYQPRAGEDYKAFVMFPVPQPQRDNADCIRGAIHISFSHQEHFDAIWPPPEDAAKLEAAIEKAHALDVKIDEAKSAAEIKSLKSEKQAIVDPVKPLARHLYDFEGSMQDTWCKDEQVKAAVREAIAILGELLYGFNENIYKISGEAVPMK